MRSSEIITEGLEQSVEDLLDQFAAKAVAPHPVTNRPGESITFLTRKPGFRIWTRFDGVRYKEPSYIHSATMAPNEIKDNIKKGYLKIPVKNEWDIIQWTWNEILNLPGVKPIGKIKGEFGSTEYKPAVQWKGIIFIKDDHVIRYATRSILKNVDIWKHEK